MALFFAPLIYLHSSVSDGVRTSLGSSTQSFLFIIQLQNYTTLRRRLCVLILHQQFFSYDFISHASLAI